QRVLKPHGCFYAATVTEKALTKLDQMMETAGIPPWETSLGFSLENGAEQLASRFPHIERRRLENTLVITETEPLLNFVRSAVPQNQQSDAKFQHLRELFQKELSQQGAIHLTMDIGLFEAMGRPDFS